MLIVLTTEREIKNETTLLNKLFSVGLKVLHLRKDGLDENGYGHIINNIEPSFYNRIMIHHHHHLCEEFNLKGVHIKEQYRLDLGDDLDNYVNRFKTSNFSVSSSFHQTEMIVSCKVDFDYHLLSPVFSSISKKGYKGKGFDVHHIEKKIIGMGGINAQTITKTFKLGFKGVGVLGGVWNTEEPVQSFISLQNIYHSIK